VPILLQKSAYTGRGTLMPFFAAVAFHPRDCAGDFADACNGVTQRARDDSPTDIG